MSRSSVSILLAFVCGCIATLSSQTVTGTITGSVADQNRAVMPGVTVKLISESTGFLRLEDTGQRGDFTFNAAPPDT